MPSTEESHTRKFETYEDFKVEWDKTLDELKNRTDLELDTPLSNGYCFCSKDLKSPEYEMIMLVNCGLKFDR